MSDATRRGGRLFIRKSVDQVQREAASHSLKRTLGAFHLVLLGIGCTIGAGIYVMTGNAAANFAGPGVMLSFIIAGTACGFAAATVAGRVLASHYSVNCLRPAVGERFIARARVVKPGKTQVFTACELYAMQNGEEKLVATGETLLTPVGDGG